MSQTEQLTPLPEAIQRRLSREMARGTFYSYAFLPPGSKDPVVKRFNKLTVGDCEQLSEYHFRRAKRALVRFEMTESKASAGTCADHIFKGNRYRQRYHELLGQEPDLRDSPFPLLSDEEAKAL